MSEVQVYALSVQNVLLSEVKGLEKYLSEEIRNKISAYKFEKDQVRSLFSHLLVHYLLQQKLNRPLPQLAYILSEKGKPRAVNAQNIHFSVSHSGRWIVCALDTDDLGVDIEEVRVYDLSDVQDSLTEEETTLIEATSADKRASLFCSIWTAKESYLKAIGEGISGLLKLDELNVRFKENRIELSVKGLDMKDWALTPLPIDENYGLTVCSKRSKNIQNEVTIIDIEDIIREISNSKH